MQHSRQACAAFIAILTALSSPAQDGRIADPTASPEGKPVVRENVKVQRVQLHPVVLDRQGRFVGNLAREDFEVREAGKPVEIETFGVETSPRFVAVALDVSRSMGLRSPECSPVVRQWLGRLAERDGAALYAFADTVRCLARLGSHQAAPDRAMAGLWGRGGTALYDALALALEDLEKAAGRRALLVYTDGEDNRSATSTDRVLALARETETTVFVAQPRQGRRGRISARDEMVLLAEETGGQSFRIGATEELPETYERVLSFLRAQYILAYEPPRGPPGVRRVSVRVRDRSLRVICRGSYAAR